MSFIHTIALCDAIGVDFVNDVYIALETEEHDRQVVDEEMANLNVDTIARVAVALDRVASRLMDL